MQPRNLLLTTLTAIFAIGGTILSDGNCRLVNAESTASSLKIDQNNSSASGSFVRVDHPTTGIATIVTKGGKQYLKFDRNFKSDSGPDLFVLLHRQRSPKQYRENDYVNLGKLKKTAGEQLYQIPVEVNTVEFKSAVIWCRLFGSTFGFAPLK
jgi:hypothetical protein